MNLRDRVLELLKSFPEHRFRARQIAEWIHASYPSETADKLRRSASLQTEADLLGQLVAEIGANRPLWQKKYSGLRTTEGRPRQFYWTEKSETEEAVIADSLTRPDPSKTIDQAFRPRSLERDLYPLVIAYIETEFSAHAQRIEEGAASNRRGPGGNKWLYPDIVAIEGLTTGLNGEVAQALRHSGERRARLWSFEIKRLLNRSNVREAYFQAVSNSSWANFGYLAAAEIEGADTLKEIQMLYAVHGIGLIEIDVDSPTESTLRIPARERLSTEWSMCSRLADENKDFHAFMKKVRHFFQTGDL